MHHTLDQHPLDHDRTRAIVIALVAGDHVKLRELAEEATDDELRAAIDISNHVYWSARSALQESDLSEPRRPAALLQADDYEPPARAEEHAGRCPRKAVAR